MRKLWIALAIFGVLGVLATVGFLTEKKIPESWEGQTITIESQTYVIQDGNRVDGSWMLIVQEQR